MADNGETPAPPTQPQTSSDSTQSLSSPKTAESHQASDSQTPVSTQTPWLNPNPTDTPSYPENRSELVARARTFLTSPHIQPQDVFAKRRFLADKGLSEAEIEGLLHELPLQMPAVPPRTYPQPPPSNLPNLLIGLTRLFSWIAGGSAALIFIYYRFLLPRITHTSLARHSLKSHHLSLLQKLTTSLAAHKESHAESLSVLPRPEPYKEPIAFGQLHSVDEVLKEGEAQGLEIKDLPTITLLRCGIEEFGNGKEGDGDAVKPRTEELFQVLEGKIPWLVSEDGLKFENELWETLSTCPLFQASPPLPSSTSPNPSVPPPNPIRWAYIPPPAQTPSPLLTSLTSLSSSLPKKSSVKQQSPYQHTLQSLSDFTGYITTQVYVPYRPPMNGIGMSGVGGGWLSPAEEELRREIRALKGLVLNRRSFMPTIPRPGSASSLRPTP